MDLWHLTFSTRGRQALFASDAGVLEGVRALGRGASGRIVLFSIVDDHVHVVVRSRDPGALTPGLCVRCARSPRRNWSPPTGER